MKKKINRVLKILNFSILLFTLTIFPQFECVANAEDLSLAVNTVGKHIGRIYYGDDTPVFEVSINNNSQSGKNITINFKVTDEDNRVKFSTAKSLYADAKCTTVFPMNVPDIGYGIFKFTAETEGLSDYENYSVAMKNYTLNDGFSVQMHLDLDYMENAEANAELAKGAGFAAVRDDLRWNKVEVSGSDVKYTVPESREEEITKIADSGLKQHLTLAYGNPLYESGKLPRSDEGIEAYISWAEWMVEHFKGRVSSYEVWNEPDLYSFTGYEKGEYQGEEYAAFLKKVYPRLRKKLDDIGETDVKIIGCAFMKIDRADTQPFCEAFMAQPDIEKYMDGFSFHPYTFGSGFMDEGSGNTYLELIEKVRADFTKLGRPNMPIWITESGTPSRLSSSADYSINERKQASDIVRLLTATRSVMTNQSRSQSDENEPLIKFYNIYNLKEKGTNLYNDEDMFGIVRNGDYSAKSAYIAASAVNSILSGAKYSWRWTDVDYKGNRAYSTYRFNKSNQVCDKEIYLMWAHSGKNATVKTVDYDFGDNTITGFQDKGYAAGKAEIQLAKDCEIEYFDMYGNKINVSRGEEVNLSTEPIYAVCTRKKITDVSVEQNGNNIKIKGVAEPYAETSMLVMREGLYEDICAVDQCRADENGYYSFDFSVPTADNTIYFVYVFDGEAKKEVKSYGQAPYRIETEYYVNGERVSKVENIGQSDDIKIRLKIADMTSDNKPLSFCGAMYGKDGCLKLLKTQPITNLTDSRETYEITFNADEVTDKSEVGLFLWKDMIPVTKSVKIKYEGSL